MIAHSTWNFEDPDLVSAIDELPLWSAPFGQALLDAVALKPHLQVLDIGSGLGFPALQLAQLLGPTSTVFVLDPWQAALTRLQLKMDQYGLSNVRIASGVAEHMAFEDESFDLITSNNGLNNVQDLRQAWSECRRVAKPGAQLVLTENLPGTMLEFYSCFKSTLSELELTEYLPAVDSHIHSKRKPIEETRQIIGESGFKIVQEKHGRFIMRFLDGSAMINSFLIRLAFLPSWKGLLPEERQDGVFEKVETALNAKAAEKGELDLTIPFVCLDCRRL
ncbi:MAG: class I SAM-dependent methyltransferase [Acidobacteria bacterium]|nr:MAG: class I SAM-dependent methyltransferase [Acidobacteriota bacterium]